MNRYIKYSLFIGVILSVLFLLGGFVGGIFTTLATPLFYLCLPILIFGGGISTETWGVTIFCVLWIMFLSYLVGLIVSKFKPNYVENNQKGSTLLPVLICIIVLLVAGGGVYFYTQNKEQLLAKKADQLIAQRKALKLTSPQVDYKNSLLGYELTVQPGWHISEVMSKKLDTNLFMMNLYNSVGCDINTFIEKDDYEVALPKLQECLKKSPDLMKIESEYKAFENSWKLETSQNIFITKLSSSDEQKLTLADLATPQSSLPKGKVVLVRTFDSVLSFKEATSTKSGLKKSFYSIGDNTKAYLTDWRGTKLKSADLILSIPISSEINMLYAGGKIKSLTVISTVDVGTQEEKDFFKTLDSLKLSK